MRHCTSKFVNISIRFIFNRSLQVFWVNAKEAQLFHHRSPHIYWTSRDSLCRELVQPKALYSSDLVRDSETGVWGTRKQSNKVQLIIFCHLWRIAWSSFPTPYYLVLLWPWQYISTSLQVFEWIKLAIQSYKSSTWQWGYSQYALIVFNGNLGCLDFESVKCLEHTISK